MIVRTRGAILAGLLVVCAADIARASDWRMDHAESKLEYIATFQKARTSGVFKEFDTQVRFDENRLTDSRIDVTVAVGTADMIDSEVNKSIRGPDWFDSARFPQAEFHEDDQGTAQRVRRQRPTALHRSDRLLQEVWDAVPIRPLDACRAGLPGVDAGSAQEKPRRRHRRDAVDAGDRAVA